MAGTTTAAAGVAVAAVVAVVAVTAVVDTRVAAAAHAVFRKTKKAGPWKGAGLMVNEVF